MSEPGAFTFEQIRIPVFTVRPARMAGIFNKANKHWIIIRKQEKGGDTPYGSTYQNSAGGDRKVLSEE